MSNVCRSLLFHTIAGERKRSNGVGNWRTEETEVESAAVMAAALPV
jgi:hypothetical protein